jgi:hypothetical protein
LSCFNTGSIVLLSREFVSLNTGTIYSLQAHGRPTRFPGSYLTFTFKATIRSVLEVYLEDYRIHIAMINFISILIDTALFQPGARHFAQFVTISPNNVSLNKVFNGIPKQTAYQPFKYSTSNKVMPITKKIKGVPIQKVFFSWLVGQSGTFWTFGASIVLNGVILHQSS